MSKAIKAVQLFEQGFAWDPSIFSVFSEEFGLDKNLALKIGDPFGAGMRGLAETCGAVTGSLMVNGIKF